MRKVIDKTALYVLLSSAAFMFFLYAWRALLPALLLSAAFLLGLSGILPRLFRAQSNRRFRKAKREAYKDRMLNKLLYAPYEDALTSARRAVLLSYGYDETEEAFEGKTVNFALIQLHKEGFPADASTVARYYRENKDSDALVLINTGAFDEKARRAAEEYTSPRIVLLDGRQIRDIFGKLDHDASDKEEPSGCTKKKRRMPRIAMSPKLVKRSAIYAILLLVLYFVLGISAYLYASLFLLALSMIARRKESAPEKLI